MNRLRKRPDRRRNLRAVLYFSLATFGLQAAGAALDHYFGPPALHFAIILWSLSTVPIALSLYWLRRRYRLAYGVFELMIAVGFVYAATLSIIFEKSDNAALLIVARWFAYMAGVYFIVRALDNIGEGFKRGSRFDRKWSRLFPRPKQ